jgi:alpha-beta hydrolase superfamily lysophospholipase
MHVFPLEKASVGAVPQERFAVTAEDGFCLSVVRWVPRAPRAILQIAHGMSEHAARYAPFAEACAAARIAVYAHDHRGHGDSVDGATPRGFFAARDGWAKVVADVHTIHDYARDANPGLPLFFLGHSMGSVIGRAYLLAHGGDVSGAILSATSWRGGPLNHALRWTALRECRKNSPSAPSPRMTGLVFGSFNHRFWPARTEYDWLSRDREVVDAYIADPRCGFACSGQLWADLFGGLSAIEAAEEEGPRICRRLPLLLLAGSHDPVSMGGLSHAQLAKRYRAGGNDQVEDRRFSGARHELLNETNRAEVWDDVLRWVESRT